MKVYLTAKHHDDTLADAWTSKCGELDFVEIVEGSILDLEVDAVVSPANSFGFMDGGIDWLYTQHFGPQVQEDLQSIIRIDRNGELLVGEAQVIQTHNKQIPFLVSAPTMRVPMILGDTTINPYLAARAALMVAKDYGIDSIAFPGLGTGVGKVPPIVCAHQMRVAIDEVLTSKKHFPTSWREAQIIHQSLYLQPARDLQYTGDKT